MLFHKKPPQRTMPSGCTAADITTQSSICTGETVIGFKQHGTDELLQAELVRTPADIAAYYASYGLKAPR